MSKIKQLYLSFYDSSREDYDYALGMCNSVLHSNECDNKCSLCPLQEIKALYGKIHELCEKGLTE